jgi:hypothetical protein
MRRPDGRRKPAPLYLSHMWNLYPFYLYPTGVYATDGFLKRFDHVLGRPTDRTRRCEERVMVWQCTGLACRCRARLTSPVCGTSFPFILI